MDRRDFLRLLLVGGAAALIRPKFDLLAQQEEERRFDDAEVWVAEGSDDVKRMTEAVVREMGGMEKFVGKGETVVIKPNIAFNRKPELAATTNPSVVATLAQLAVTAGAKEVLVLDRAVNNPHRTYKTSGIKEAVERVEGAKLVYPDWKGEIGFVEKRIPNAVSLKSWTFMEEVLKADVLINVPVAKNHGLTTLTLSVKNFLGVVGGTRGKLHRNIHQNLVDIARFLKDKVRLVIIDAFRIVVQRGPQGGKPEYVRTPKTIIGSKNMFTADAYATRLFVKEPHFKGLTPEKLGFLKLGFEQNLGEIRLNRITVHKVRL